VSLMSTIELIKTVGSIASAFLGVVAVLGMLLKPVRQSFVNFIAKAAKTNETDSEVSQLRELIESQNAELKASIEQIKLNDGHQAKKLDDLTEAVALSNRASRAALGNTIKHIYYKYLPSKRLPIHEIESLHMIHRTYKEEGGNSFVDAIFDEMMNEWEHTT